MTDIVATIQAEQDRIIRSDLNRALVVQGGPGTGKTAVALHRAAYLLYTHRRKLERSGVLVIGPSTTFLRYIDQVLPSLGETGVVSRTIADLIPGIKATATDTPLAAKLKGDRRMAQVVANAIALRERVPQDLPTVHVNGFAVKARETFVRTMLMALRDRYAEQLDYTPSDDELNEALTNLRLNDKVRVALNLAWLPMNGTWLIDNLWSHPLRLRALAPWLDDDGIAALTRPKGAPMTQSDVPLLDEAMELLGPDPKIAAQIAAKNAKRAQEEQFAQDTLNSVGLGSGIVSSQMLVDQMNGEGGEFIAQRAAADREWTYGHVVVDEAQELTAMDWRMLIRRCPSRSFTIVGDVAQTSALGGTRRWDRTMNRLFGERRWDLNAVRRIIVDGESDTIATAASHVAQLAKQFVDADGTGRVAVIAPSHMLDPLRSTIFSTLPGTLGQHETNRLSEQHEWDAQISVGSTESVKGLEFDAVVVVQPGRIEQDAPSRLVAASDLYVAMTRPTQRLVIVRTGEDETALQL